VSAPGRAAAPQGSVPVSAPGRAAAPQGSVPVSARDDAQTVMLNADTPVKAQPIKAYR
jgi:hypothetical protein